MEEVENIASDFRGRAESPDHPGGQSTPGRILPRAGLWLALPRRMTFTQASQTGASDQSDYSNKISISRIVSPSIIGCSLSRVAAIIDFFFAWSVRIFSSTVPLAISL